MSAFTVAIRGKQTWCEHRAMSASEALSADIEIYVRVRSFIPTGAPLGTHLRTVCLAVLAGQNSLLKHVLAALDPLKNQRSLLVSQTRPRS